MPESPAYYALLSRLRKVYCTDNLDLVEGLSIEPGPDEPPRLIRGFIMEPGPAGPRRVPCSWLPNGRHRLYPKLNLSLPDSE